MKISDLMESLDQSRPLLICDVDEVVLHFVAPFEVFLAEKDMRLRKTSFQLAGNIINKTTGAILSSHESSDIALQFHEQSVDQQPVIEDAIEVLTALSTHFQIVFLTNVAKELSMRRVHHLTTLGLAFPLLQNTGSKSGTVAQLADFVTAPTIFVDDLPQHHTMIKAASPEVFCIHFMADNEFRNIAEITPNIAEKAENWHDIKSLCLLKI